MTIATIAQTPSTLWEVGASVLSQAGTSNTGTSLLAGMVMLVLLELGKPALSKASAAMLLKTQKGLAAGACCIIAGQVARLASSSTMGQIASSMIAPLGFAFLSKRSTASFSIWHPLTSLKAVPYAVGLGAIMAVYVSMYPISMTATAFATVILSKLFGANRA